MRGRVILVTTSRRPTERIRALCNDLARSIPGAVRVNRGKMNLDGVAEKALEIAADRVVVVNRWRGGLGKIEFFKVGLGDLTSVFPILYIASVRLQREYTVKIGLVRSLAATTSPRCSSGEMKTAESLANFFNIPFLSKEKPTFKHQALMYFSSNTSRRTQITFIRLPKFIEVGPRIIISHIAWENRK
jgi:rRNA maturation protein Rpf1